MSKKLLKQEEFCLATFANTHNALAGEKLLAAKACEFLVVPTPREITSSCGLSIKFDFADLAQIGPYLTEKFPDIVFYHVKKGKETYISKI